MAEYSEVKKEYEAYMKLQRESAGESAAVEANEDEEQIEYVKAPKKPPKKRRVVVVQDSSSEEEVEVVLPKQKRAKEPAQDPEYSRMYNRLFSMY